MCSLDDLSLSFLNTFSLLWPTRDKVKWRNENIPRSLAFPTLRVLLHHFSNLAVTNHFHFPSKKHEKRRVAKTRFQSTFTLWTQFPLLFATLSIAWYNCGMDWNIARYDFKHRIQNLSLPFTFQTKDMLSIVGVWTLPMRHFDVTITHPHSQWRRVG